MCWRDPYGFWGRGREGGREEEKGREGEGEGGRRREREREGEREEGGETKAFQCYYNHYHNIYSCRCQGKSIGENEKRSAKIGTATYTDVLVSTTNYHPWK